MHTLESNASMLSRVIFYLKSVNFLFLFSIYSRMDGWSNPEPNGQRENSIPTNKHSLRGL